MKVLFFVSEFPAASETFVLDQITGLIDRGIDVRVMARVPRTECIMQPTVARYKLLERTTYINVESRRKQWCRYGLAIGDLAKQAPVKALGALLKSVGAKLGGAPSQLEDLIIAKAIRDQGTRIAICHFGPNGAHLSRLAQLYCRHVKVVTFFHGYDLSTILQNNINIYDALFTTGSLFLPVTDYWRRLLLQLGAPESRVYIHRMGIRLDNYLLRGTEAGSKGTLRLLSIGRLVEKKGHEYAVRALAEYIKWGGAKSDVHLKIIGDGPLRPHLEHLVRNLELSDVVEFTGIQDSEHIADALAHSDVFILPSVTSSCGDMEGLPVSILEAMASGLPVISTYHSGIPEAVDHDVSGILVAERDIGGLADAIRRFADDRNSIKRMGEKGRLRVRDEYDLEFWNNRLATLINELNLEL